MKTLLWKAFQKLQKISPTLYFAIIYHRSAKKMFAQGLSPTGSNNRTKLFEDFLLRYKGKSCLQIGVKDSIGRKFGDNWISVDKFDTRDMIDYNMAFEDNSMDAVVCWSILERSPILNNP